MCMCVGALFPAGCAGCGVGDTTLCSACYKKILPLLCQCCPYCQRVSHGGRTCDLCRAPGRLDGLLVGATFAQEDLLQRSIHAMKYKGRREIASKLVEALWARVAFDSSCTLVAVPLSKVRRQERGYNQALDLALAYSTIQGLDIQDCLERTRHTQPQARLGRVERLTNLAGAFTCLGPAPPRVMLVDDVATTLSTLHACADALRQAGAYHVYGLVLARALRHV